MMSTTLKKHWLLLAIAIAVIAARSAPSIGVKGGFLRPEYTIKFGAVPAIFFNSGVTLPAAELGETLGNIRLHVLVQGFSMALIPTIMMTLGRILLASELMHEDLVFGFMVLGCLPPPVSSAVVLTKAASGNEAAAIFNSALGSLFGITITPLLLLNLVGVGATLPVNSLIMQLSTTVILPLVLGQIVRGCFWESSLQHLNIPFGVISNIILLAIIYTTFCESFARPLPLQFADIALAIACCVLLIVAFTALAYSIGKMAGLTPRDTVAMVFCSTHKSLTLGMPILSMLYANHPALPYISMPLLCWHPTQIFLGGIFAPVLRQRLSREKHVLPLPTIITSFSPLASPERSLKS